MPGTSKNQTIKLMMTSYAMLSWSLCSQNWFRSSVPWRNQNDSNDAVFRFSELSRMNASRPKQRRLIFHSKFTAQILNTSGALYYFDNSNAWVKHYRDIVVKSFLLLMKTLQLFRRRPQRETLIVKQWRFQKQPILHTSLYWDPLNMEKSWFHY